MDIGKVLTNLRKSKSLSRQSLADKLEISVHTYIKYENESVKPPYDTLIKLADFYEVTTDYLLGREPLPDPFADLNLNRDNEKDVIEKYMSLSDETRAVLLDILIQLGEAAKGKQQIRNDIQQTDRMITEKIVAFGGDNIEREVSEDEVIRRFEALEEERRKKEEK